jgi:hypothetical protein
MAQETYTTKRFHPVTLEQIECRVFLNYYGTGQDGYRFKGDSVMYSKEELDAMAPQTEPSG